MNVVLNNIPEDGDDDDDDYNLGAAGANLTALLSNLNSTGTFKLDTKRRQGLSHVLIRRNLYTGLEPAGNHTGSAWDGTGEHPLLHATKNWAKGTFVDVFDAVSTLDLDSPESGANVVLGVGLGYSFKEDGDRHDKKKLKRHDKKKLKEKIKNLRKALCGSEGGGGGSDASDANSMPASASTLDAGGASAAPAAYRRLSFRLLLDKEKMCDKEKEKGKKKRKGRERREKKM